MKKSIWILCAAAGLLMADFVRDDAKEIVTDTTACLEWQDNAEANSTRKTWQEAIDYCEALELDGGGWRLPNFNELYSIGDRSKVDPAIQDGFVNVSSSSYWSSTTYVNGTYAAWGVVFYSGGGNHYEKYSNGYENYGTYVRCVRDGE